MDKMKKYLLMLADLFVAAISFTACSSEEDLANAEEEQERGVVKTEFTISIPQRLSGVTRMTTAIVQGQETTGGEQAPVFRGIQNIFLYPLNNNATTLKTPDDGAAAMNLSKAITLFKGTATDKWYGPGNSTYDNMLDQDAIKSGSNSHLYKDVEIPIGTQSLLFYGEAYREANTDNFDNGCLKNNLGTAGQKLSQIRFEPQSIKSSNEVSSNGLNIAAYMTAIAQAAGWRTTTDVVLATLYDNFTGIRAGSWKNVKGAVQELYSSIYSRTTSGHVATDANSTFAEADAIADAILNTNIGTTNDKFVTSSSGSTLTFVSDATLQDYPTDDMGLPDGAAQISWDNSNSEPAKWKFTALTATGNTGLNVAALTSYAYPAPLYYQVLSDVRVSESSKYSIYNIVNSWANVLAAYDKVPDSDPVKYYRTVTSKTRSIAVDDQIQYAVGRLDVTIKAGEFSLKDFQGNSISVGTQNFKLTGVFVDGQKAVDYQFHQVGTDSYTIYDKKINDDIYLTTSTSSKNHTLVLETAASQVVNIAVELENLTTKKLIGKNGCIIYPGCKFYLKGVLDPSNKSFNKVFMQDYYTIANLTINNFQNAYNILPDLRSPELELGVSVDLEWKEGNTYNINMD